MLDAEWIKYTIPAVVAVAGWFAAHQFDVRRDRQNKRRDLRVQFLLEAYRRLESAANREDRLTELQRLAFESAVADIQLLGSPEQVSRTVAYARQYAANPGVKIDELLRLLRRDLRAEIGISGEAEDAVFFRFTRQP